MKHNSTVWQEETLGNLGEIVAGGTPSRSIPSYWNGSIPWVTPGEITNLKGKYLRETREKITTEGFSASAARLLPKDSILVTTRATLGEVAIAAVPVTTNQGFKSIVPNEGTDPVFTYYLVHTLRSEMIRLASGTTFLEISKADFSRIVVRRPAPNEQLRIGAVLEAVDDAVTQTEAVIKKLKHVRAGVFHDLLTRGLDEDGQLRDPRMNPDQFCESPLGLIPRAWITAEIGHLFDLQSGATPSRQQQRFYRGGTIPWVKTLDLNENWVTSTDEQITDAALSETSCRLLPERTVLVAMYGGWEQIGRTGILRVPAATNQAICALAPKSTQVEPEFALRVLQVNRRSWRRVAASTRKDPNITKSDVGRFSIAFPLDLAEQRAICDRIAALDATLLAEEMELAKLQQLKAGIADDVLNGIVPVPDTIMGVEL